MTQRRNVPKRLSEGHGFDSAGFSPQREDHRPFTLQCRQRLACISATVTMVIVGTVYGWTTTSIPHLISGTSGMPLKLTEDESSWMVSLTIFGSMFGSLVGAHLADCCGRRNSLIVSNIILIIGWLILYFADSVSMLYLTRLVFGTGIGIAYTINPMYVSEIADIKIRAVLGALITQNIFIGLVLTCTLGLWLSYKSLLVVLITISFISFLSNTYFPESPYFLVARGRKWQARRSIRYYKGIVDPHEMEIELCALGAQTRYELRAQHIEPRRKVYSRSRGDLRTRGSNVNPRKSIDADEIYIDLPEHTWSTKLRAILQRSNRKALFIMLGLVIAQEYSGNFMAMQYLQLLFTATKNSTQPNVAMTWVMAVGLISAIISTIILDRYRRRTLLILSTIGSCLTLLILGTFLLLAQNKFDVSNFYTLPILDIIMYQVLFQIGLGTLPTVLLCELFPTELKGFAGAIMVIFDGIIGFTLPTLYQVFNDNVGPNSIYFFFATSCGLAFLMVFKWLPETKGKTYEEIEALLLGKNLNPFSDDVRAHEMLIHKI